MIQPLFLDYTGHDQYDAIASTLHHPIRIPGEESAVVMYEGEYSIKEVCRAAGVPEPVCEVRSGNGGVLVRLGILEPSTAVA